MSLFQKLASSDVDDVLDGLYELGASNTEEFSPELLQLLTRLSSHHDAEVRLEIAAAVGIRLRRSDFYEVLFQRLAEREEDESVLRVLMDATTAISIRKDATKEDLSHVLASYVLRVDLADETRGVAYLCLLKLWHKISPKEYAKTPSELSKMSWDRNFVERLGNK